MFICCRDAKNSIAPRRCAGQPMRFVHNSATRPSSRASGAAQNGHTVGGANRGPLDFSVIARISGMISPAFCNSTRSPAPRPNRAT